ncbi:MAG TPA: diacylglycerol kinase family protein [Mycobacteriales bacterium]|nr:diacylglycerol kinase family protein [Mycobacteriales bacterium]
MRALLVVNPKATATSARERDVLIRALGSDLKVDLEETTHRGHAIELGTRAVNEAYDLVVVLGGDGTINEVVNGLLGPGEWAGSCADTPALAVVPGGSTNVFSRALGISRDPVEATSELLEALRAERFRQIGMGRVNERWFTFTAGVGLDADAVRRVEKARSKGKRATPSRYTRCAVTSYFASEKRRAPITLELPGEEPIVGVYLAITSNTSPWTYFRSQPVVVAPQCTFEGGLDLVTRDRMGLLPTLWSAGGMLTGHGLRGRHSRLFHDLAEFTLTLDTPMHLQVDGDYLGMHEEGALRLRAVPDALRVLA